MGQQNSCKALIGVHLTMHLMHHKIIMVLQLLHICTCPLYMYVKLYIIRV